MFFSAEVRITFHLLFIYNENYETVCLEITIRFVKISFSWSENTSFVIMLSSKIDRALFYSSPSWDSPIVKITKTPLHVLSSLSVMTKAEQAKPQVTNQDTSTNPEGTNPSGTCKDQGPGTIQPRPRGLCQQRKFFSKYEEDASRDPLSFLPFHP